MESSSAPLKLASVPRHRAFPFVFVLMVCVGATWGFSLPSFPSMAAAAVDSSRPLKVLVFGGNGFLGGATVASLLEAGHEVVTVNRGNWYWDSAFLVKPHVQQVTCDRLYPLEKCQAMVDMVSNVTAFDAVIDFSAYHPEAVTGALQVLKDKLKLYIYISTDSVYDVCDKTHTHPSTEMDSERPQSLERQEELESHESYGHRKLLIEEELARQRVGGGVPYITLRLPDVIGPRDNTFRWWIYQSWMRLSDHLDKALAIPTYLVNTPMSVVYVPDVADVILKLLHPKPEAMDQAFNIACKETPTLLQLLTDMKAALNISDLPVLTDDSETAVHLFPSVKSGPVDISKAVDILGFTPTSLHQAVAETVEFYEKAMRNPYFHVPRKEIIRNLQTHFTSRPFKVLLGLKKHYGLDFQTPKDEL